MMHDKVAGVIGRDDSRHSSMDLSVPTVLRPRVRSTAQPLRFSSLHFNCDERRTKIKTKRCRDLKKETYQTTNKKHLLLYATLLQKANPVTLIHEWLL